MKKTFKRKNKQRSNTKKVALTVFLTTERKICWQNKITHWNAYLEQDRLQVVVIWQNFKLIESSHTWSMRSSSRTLTAISRSGMGAWAVSCGEEGREMQAAAASHACTATASRDFSPCRRLCTTCTDPETMSLLWPEFLHKLWNFECVSGTHLRKISVSLALWESSYLFFKLLPQVVVQYLRH